LLLLAIAIELSAVNVGYPFPSQTTYEPRPQNSTMTLTT